MSWCARTWALAAPMTSSPFGADSRSCGSGCRRSTESSSRATPGLRSSAAAVERRSRRQRAGRARARPPSRVPVINALSDLYHPCQALADVQTIREHFGVARLDGLKLTFIGDGNNVAQSLMLTGLRLGMDFALGCPEGYLPDPEIVTQAEGLAAATGARLLITHDTAAAAAGAHAIYTDVWASMGQEQEAVERKRAFRSYQVNDALFAQARPDAVFMHCLPAKRDEEVTDSIMEHPRSVVFDQAENRLHAQKALLLMMLT